MEASFEKRSMASLMLPKSGRGNRTMNSKRGLMTVLVGLAIVATPIVAAAKDHNHYDSHAARVSSNFAPAAVTRHEFRNGSNRTWMPAPAAVARHDWHRGWGNGNAYGYGYNGYSGAPVYAAPVYAAPVYSGYGGGYGGGGQGCGGAQRVMRTYARDRATGHPAAAADLLRQNQWALRSGCAGGATYGGGGLFSGLGGLGSYRGAPAYNNYGGGGLLGGLGGLGGNRNAPVYGNGGYNGGYGQPYGGGSTLAPLLQYIR
jgi:hypothetical protein